MLRAGGSRPPRRRPPASGSSAWTDCPIEPQTWHRGRWEVMPVPADIGAVPLRRRPIDMLFVVFFAVNAVVITYAIDLEQLVIADPARFRYPIWPPRVVVDLVHWYGRSFDPLLMARPPFWRMTIWIDILVFGPF